jgi:5-methylcytosine-specific restriction endonuclease McrA
MEATSLFENAVKFAAHLGALRKKRRRRELKVRSHGRKRQSLTPSERQAIMNKTRGRCHICGGKIIERNWTADHVFAHAQGGLHCSDNYLPAHPICNQYRWFFGPEEFQWILKLGVWFRTQIQTKKSDALGLAESFLLYEARRERRRKKKSPSV